MKPNIQDQIQRLAPEDQLSLLRKVALLKLDKFLKKNNLIPDEAVKDFKVLSFFLLLPSDLRKYYSKIIKSTKIQDSEEVLNALSTLSKSKLINEYLDLENKDLSKRLYINALYLQKEKSKYVTDLSIVKDHLKMIVPKLRKTGVEDYEITNLVCDLFIHFNFDNARNQNYESLQKKTSMMIQRL